MICASLQVLIPGGYARWLLRVACGGGSLLSQRQPARGGHEAQEAAMTTYTGYCVKCREKREFEGERVDLANGRFAAQGACPVCGTAMVKMLGTDR